MNKLGGHSLILPSKVDEVTEAVDQTKTRTRGDDANLADVISAMTQGEALLTPFMAAAANLRGRSEAAMRFSS